MLSLMMVLEASSALMVYLIQHISIGHIVCVRTAETPLILHCPEVLEFVRLFYPKVAWDNCLI
jgi:hypothetical protein